MEIVTIGGLPVYNALVTDEGTGMFRISLVDDPAVQSNFLAFDETKRVPMYAVSDEDRRLVLGVIMRADFPIFRRDTGFGEYYVIYKADAIRAMAERYLLEGRQNNVNLMHAEGSDVEGVQMVQFFIKDTEKGVNPANFDVADGSLLAEFHVVNDDIWAEIKAGTYKGFSLEGVFDLVPERNVEVTKKIVDDLDGKFSKQPTKQSNPMTKLARLREKLARLLAEFGSVTTDRGVLAWDGDEDLKAGDRVYIEDQDGNRTDAPEGDYRTEDGKTIVVVDGQVAEIRDPEAEVAPQAEDEAERTDEEMSETRPSRFARIREAFEENYDAKTRQIAAAIFVKRGNNNFWIAEAADTYAVIAHWSEETYDTAYTRYPITWDEDGKAVAGDGEDVKLMFVPIDYVSPFEDESREEEAESLRAENEALRNEIEALKAMPAAKPAHEEVKAAAETPVTGNKGLDRLAKLATAK